ncbi:MAG TPA: glyoxylate/hydroxypyruvate reductase A [Bdellovibrionota bacterium]|nr:glyoxylate/hydroxypyruvate reductase A [Bdellovibrionota bacterium]
MALLFITTSSREVSGWVQELNKLDPSLDVRVWPHVGNKDEITFVAAWYHEPGIFKKFKNLKCISSLGAGVDHLLSDEDLPSHISLVRIVDTSLVQSMTEYVVWAVLDHYRKMGDYRNLQSKKQWPVKPLPLESRAQNFCVGFMGIGQLGSHIAQKLSLLGFKVCGWSRTPKKIAGVTSFSGAQELDAFLAEARILVCLLPLTHDTKGILNSKLFKKLPKGAYLINVARGELLVEEDVLKALDLKLLSGACFDVFCKEPLPEEHPFWAHPRITITPHISSVTNPKTAAPQLLENYNRSLQNKPLLNLVDRKRGY